MSVFDLSDRVAIVTGGTGGVGLALARGLVQQAVVTAAARNRDKRRAPLTQRRAFGVAAEFLVIDITERLSCDENYPGQILSRQRARQQCRRNERKKTARAMHVGGMALADRHESDERFRLLSSGGLSRD